MSLQRGIQEAHNCFPRVILEAHDCPPSVILGTHNRPLRVTFRSSIKYCSQIEILEAHELSSNNDLMSP